MSTTIQVYAHQVSAPDADELVTVVLDEEAMTDYDLLNNSGNEYVERAEADSVQYIDGAIDRLTDREREELDSIRGTVSRDRVEDVLGDLILAQLHRGTVSLSDMLDAFEALGVAVYGRSFAV